MGLLAATIYLFNPATIFNSAVWGQVDSVGTLVILGTLYALASGWTEAAALGATIALLVKFQYAFLIPIVAIVGIRRHLFGVSADPAHDGQRDPLRVLTSVAVGVGALVLLLAPFGMTVWSPNPDPNVSLIGKFGQAATTYQGLAINAINLWRNAWSGLGDTLQWGCDVPPVPPALGCNGPGLAFAVGGFAVSWQLLGTLLFAAAALVALWQVWRHDEPEGILLGALLVAVAFFVVPTRVHERYLFPAIALGALLVLRAAPRPNLNGTLVAVAAAVAVAIGLDVVPGARLVGDGTWPAWFLVLFPLAGRRRRAPARALRLGRALRLADPLAHREHPVGLHRRLVVCRRAGDEPGLRRPPDGSRPRSSTTSSGPMPASTCSASPPSSRSAGSSSASCTLLSAPALAPAIAFSAPLDGGAGSDRNAHAGGRGGARQPSGGGPAVPRAAPSARPP